MLKVEFTCGKCGCKEWHIEHGYVRGSSKYAYAIVCNNCDADEPMEPQN
jgi:hypothetical protein